MSTILITNALIVNEGFITKSDVFIKDGLIYKIADHLDSTIADIRVDAKGKYLIPGIIDDQVHFREPGLTQKGDIYTESRAAVAGGVTSFMEMPNTVPNALTQKLLAEKYELGAKKSLANYSFFMGTSNDNLQEVLKTDKKNVCGIKIFMGSSTGNMLVNEVSTLEKVFSQADMLIATHCEDEETVKANVERYKKEFGDNIEPSMHAEIRNEAACLKSSSMAADLAKKYNTRLHILHISTEEELKLFTNTVRLKEKRITSEVCLHHLWFDKTDYSTLGNLIKWNPAIKEARHKKALFEALLDDRLDIIATDHAPHTWEEKQNPYLQAPSGGPLVQHSLNLMMEFYKQGKISLEKIVEKMCHAPAICFQINKRGFIREGYWADLALVDMQEWVVSKENLFYKCGWSALEGQRFSSKVTHTFVSGRLVYQNGHFDNSRSGERLTFDR